MNRGRWGSWMVVLAGTWVAGCSFSVSGLAPLADAGPNAYQCSCQCANPPVTRQVFVTAGEDDAEELIAGGAVNLTSTDLELGATQLIGLRFQNLGIPQGATIVSAHLQLVSDDPATGDVTLTLQGEASDSAAPFTATAGNLSARPRTTATVAWVPEEWPTAGEAGPDQQSPQLAAVLQELVNRPGYTPDSAVALLISGAGGGQRIAASWNLGGDSEPRLTILFAEPSVEVALDACAPPELNPNLTPFVELTEETMTMDCEGRVETTVRGLAGACGYPAQCECAVVPMTGPTFAEVCNAECVGEPVTGDCANFDPVGGVVTATHAGSDVPVCVTASPVTAAMFGQFSECSVSGTATLTAEDESRSTGASGLIAFSGGPCPEGSSCEVGARYRLALEPIHYDTLFSSATFEDLMGTGHSLAGAEALLSPSGVGAFAPGATTNSARGRRGSEVMGVRGSNGGEVTVSLQGGAERSCGLNGALVSAVDPELKRCEPHGPNASQLCSDDAACADDVGCTDEVCNCLPIPSAEVTVAMALTGSLFNQPPEANAGPDQVVECNLPGRARFNLASQSSDPDGNLAQLSWRAGSRVGPAVGATRVATVEQPAGTLETYLLRVLDARGQSDEDTASVQVVDTTAPALFCNAPPTLSPPDPPLSFTASAEDVCDAAVVPEITATRCYRINGAGKVIDLTHACGLEVDGPTLTVRRSLGVGNHIRWSLRATDVFGNVTTADCEVEVVRP